MKVFTNHKVIKTDLGRFTLGDALEKLEQEDFFKYDTSFDLVEKVSDNHVIFGIPRDRVPPRKIHEFIYNESTKNIEVNSKYDNLFFPNLFLYLMPLHVMYMGGLELVIREWRTFSFILFGITIFNLLVALTGLKSDVEAIERELAIRLNYLARNKR